MIVVTTNYATTFSTEPSSVTMYSFMTTFCNLPTTFDSQQTTSHWKRHQLVTKVYSALVSQVFAHRTILITLNLTLLSLQTKVANHGANTPIAVSRNQPAQTSRCQYSNSCKQESTCSNQQVVFKKTYNRKFMINGVVHMTKRHKAYETRAAIY